MKFAPMDIPFERRLQTCAILTFSVTFMILPPICLITLLYILSTDHYWIGLGYLLWMFYDTILRRTSSRGGRHAKWLRTSALWRYFRDFFPVKLVKTGDFDPQDNYLLGYHPHGVAGCGALCNFASDTTGFSAKYSGVKSHLMTLQGNFRWPIM